MPFKVKNKYTDEVVKVYGVWKENIGTPKFLVFEEGEFIWVWASIYKP